MTNSKLRAEQKFELYLRLGELYAERHDYIRELEIRDYESKHDRWLANNKKGKEPNLSHKASRSILYKAVESFRAWLEITLVIHAQMLRCLHWQKLFIA